MLLLTCTKITCVCFIESGSHFLIVVMACKTAG